MCADSRRRQPNSTFCLSDRDAGSFQNSDRLSHTLNFRCLAGGFINFDQRAVQTHIILCHLKTLRHIAQESPDDRLDVAAQHALTRAAPSKGRRVKSKFLSAKVKSGCSEGGSPSSLGRKAPEFRTKELDGKV